MRRIVLLFGAALLVGGCGAPISEDQLDEIRVDASNALEAAERANRALDDGAASGTTMGDELQSAIELAHDARADALEAQAQVAEMEMRLSAICATAPQLCY